MEKPLDHSNLDAWIVQKNKAPFEVTELQNPEVHAAYTRQMVAELKALNIPKRPASTEQAPSMSRLMSMTEDELDVYRNRLLPTVAQAGANTDAEAVFSTHKSDDQTRYAAETVRHTHGGNRIGDAVSTGASAFSKEKRESATNAFMEAQPLPLSNLDKYRIAEGYLDGETRVIETKSSLWSLIWGKFKPAKGDKDNLVSWKDYVIEERKK